MRLSSIPLPTSAHPIVDEILTYWFGDSTETMAVLTRRWFGGDPTVDRQIGERFGGGIERALAGGLKDWESDADSRLALILILDQFPRHVFRGRARAFSGDPRARRLCRQALDQGLFVEWPWPCQVFALMPLEHSESLVDQDQMVAALEHLHRQADPEDVSHLGSFLRAAKEHRSIIRQFGRFPHRNAALGRVSSEAELAYLVDGPHFGQGSR